MDPLALVRPHLRGLAPGGTPPPSAVGARARLDANENALGPSPRALQALQRAASEAHRYPDPGGGALKAKIAEKTGLTPAHVALGPGSDALIARLVHLFAGPGDEVVAAHPSFVTYRRAAQMHGATFVAVPGDGIDHDLDAMLAAITPRTRILFVCDPNNPTGAHLPPGAFERFIDRVPDGVVVAYDEAYREYVDDAPDTLALLERETPLVLLRTFSKIYGLAGLRIGYALARPELAALFARVALAYDVNGLALEAARAALDDDAHVARCFAFTQAGRPRLRADLDRFGIKTYPSWTNFVLADFGVDCRPRVHALAQKSVLVREMTLFGMDSRFARIGVGTDDEHQALLEALEATA